MVVPSERRRSRWLARGALAIVLCMLGGWSVLGGARQLEADNEFCIGCHDDNGRPLHQAQYQQLGNGRGGTMAAAHHGTVSVDGVRRPMRCIDCHRGADGREQLSLDWVAFKDLGAHLTGSAGAGGPAKFKISDPVCEGCHSASGDGYFHRLRPHRGVMTVACVDCHRSHVAGAGPARTDPPHTLKTCARCHPGLASGVRRVAQGLPIFKIEKNAKNGP